MGKLGGSDTSSSTGSIGIEQRVSVDFMGPNSATGVDDPKQEECIASSSQSKLKFHFLEMGFSSSLVDRAFKETGGEDEELLLSTLCTYMETNPDGLFDTTDDAFGLLEMGFTQEEISYAIGVHGLHVPVYELVDAIYAQQISKEIKNDNSKDLEKHTSKDEDQKDTMNEASTPAFDPRASECKKAKRPKHSDFDEQEEKHGFCNPYLSEPSIASQAQLKVTPNAPVDHLAVAPGPPYFLYGDVLGVPESSWEKVSRFLNGAEPELVDSMYFSATERKEAYVHNLPMENRVHVVPPSPKTIQEALPEVGKWWPSWDRRKKIGFISTDTGVRETCQRISRMLVQSHEMPSCEDRNWILHQCRTHNLIWTEQCTVSMIQPKDMESIFGYPRLHTSGLDYTERVTLLKYNFQVDTLGYHLSVLRELFPRGINVLSLNSGISGEAVALHKLGVRLNCFVSVEPLELHRMILRRWWNSTSQTGELIEINGIEKMTTARVECMVKELGGFQFVIARNPGKFTPFEVYRDSLEDVNFPLFFEFVRVLNCVRRTMSSEIEGVVNP